MMNGIFAFAIYDSYSREYFIARDHVGIIPLYIGWDDNDVFFVASELKALEGHCRKIELFPPGHYLNSSKKDLKKWYSRDWELYENVMNVKSSITKLKASLENAVQRQLMSDVPYGVLLSGGLDSSITSAIAKKFSEKESKQITKNQLGGPNYILFLLV